MWADVGRFGSCLLAIPLIIRVRVTLAGIKVPGKLRACSGAAIALALRPRNASTARRSDVFRLRQVRSREAAVNARDSLRPLRVAQVTPVYPPHRGGMGQVALEYAAGLTHRGHIVQVFTPEYANPRPIGPEVTRLTSPFRVGNAAFVPSLAWRLRGYDVVHLHYPFFGGAEPVLLRKALHPEQALIVSYVMDASAPGLRGAIFRAHQRFVLPRVLAHADRVLVSSLDYAEASALRTCPGELDRVEVHPFGVDATRFRPGSDTLLRTSIGIPLNATVLLFVAALDPPHHFKGLRELFDALATVDSPWYLAVVGDGSSRAEFERIAAAKGLAARVHFAGDVSDEDLPRYYRMADLHVLPSTSAAEAFGLVCLEAAASGIPTIASALPGVRTVVLDGETGVHVMPRNITSLADGIRRLLHHPELRRRLGHAARRRAETQFAWHVRVAELETTYFETRGVTITDRQVAI